MQECKECGSRYIYNNELGYSEDICSPYCDGKMAGRKQAAKRCKQIAQQCYQAVTIDERITKEFDL